MAIQDEIHNLKTNISTLSSNETQPMPSGMKQDNAEIIAVLTESIAKETNPEAKAEIRKNGIKNFLEEEKEEDLRPCDTEG